MSMVGVTRTHFTRLKPDINCRQSLATDMHRILSGQRRHHEATNGYTQANSSERAAAGCILEIGSNGFDVRHGAIRKEDPRLDAQMLLRPACSAVNGPVSPMRRGYRAITASPGPDG